MEPISIIIIIAGVETFVGGMFVTFYNCYLEQKEKNSIKIPVADLGANDIELDNNEVQRLVGLLITTHK